jgi:predicted Zn-dependent peptidase
MVFSAAGNLDHESFLEQVEAKFGGLAASGPADAVEPAPVATPHITLKKKKSLEQVQMCLGVVAPPVNHADRYGLYLLSSMLGGGMSSRLFQTVREDRGLAYSIYSEMSPFRDTGSLSVYAGMSLENTEQVLQLTLGEFRRLKEETVSTAELEQAKNQSKSNIVLGLESSSSRMSNLARQQMYFGRFFTIDEITAAIDAVTVEDVQRLAQELLRPERLALTLLGNLGAMKIGRGDLMC